MVRSTSGSWPSYLVSAAWRVGEWDGAEAGAGAGGGGRRCSDMVEVLSFVLGGSGLGLHRMGVGNGEDSVLCPFGSQWLGSVE